MANQEFLKLLNDFEKNPSRTLIEWQRVLNHILSNLSNGSYVATDGANVTIADALGLLTAANVEDAIAELANKISSGSTRITTLTGTTTLTPVQFGVVICNSASDMTLNLPTAIGANGFGYIVNNIGVGTVTINPYGTQTLQGDLTFDLYTDEVYGFTSNDFNWFMV